MTTILCPKRKVARFSATNVPFWPNVLTWLPVVSYVNVTTEVPSVKSRQNEFVKKKSRNPNKPKPRSRAAGRSPAFASYNIN